MTKQPAVCLVFTHLGLMGVERNSWCELFLSNKIQHAVDDYFKPKVYYCHGSFIEPSYSGSFLQIVYMQIDKVVLTGSHW